MTTIASYALTESGRDARVNEDACYVARRVFPDLIGGRERFTGSAQERRQLYMVAGGFGGARVGDIACRIAFQVVAKAMDAIETEGSTFEFLPWMNDVAHEINQRLASELSLHAKRSYGVSLALVMIIGSLAYTVSIGASAVLLLRDGELFLQAKPQMNDNGTPDQCLVAAGDRPLTITNAKRLPLLVGDRLLLVTGGALSALSLSTIEHALSGRDLEQAILTLIDDANRRNDATNKTMVGLEVESITPSTRDESLERHVSRAAQAKVRRERALAARPSGHPETPRSERRESPAPRAHRETTGRLFLKSYLVGLLVGLALVLIAAWIFIFR